MFCKKCGRKLDDGDLFCPKCGTPTGVTQDEDNGIAPKDNDPKTGNDGSDLPPSDGCNDDSGEKNNNDPVIKRVIKKALGILLKLLLILFIILGIIIALDYSKLVDFKPALEKIDTLKEDRGQRGFWGTDDTGGVISGNYIKDDYTENGKVTNEYEDEIVDVKQSFDESQLISETNVQYSESASTENEVIRSLKERGFDNLPTYDYSIDGEYCGTSEASNSSNERHPIYTTDYISSSGVMWSIIEINRRIIANPVSYNVETKRDIPIIISESDIITSYDSINNKYYDIKPDDSELTMIVVDTINSEVLDSLTIEALDRL